MFELTGLWGYAKIILAVIGFMLLVQLLELPEWLERKLHGDSGKKDELKKKLAELEERISRLENKE